MSRRLCDDQHYLTFDGAVPRAFRICVNCERRKGCSSFYRNPQAVLVEAWQMSAY